MILRLKKIFTPDFDLFDTVEKITKILKKETEVRIGISFFVQCGPTAELVRYYFSIFNRSLTPMTLLSDPTDCQKLLSFLRPMTNSDILNLAFSQVNQENVFEKSDFRPRRLVLATIWLVRS